MSQRYIHSGKVRRRPSLQRGVLLVYSEEEWARRAKIESREAYVTIWKILLVVVIVPLMLLVLSLVVPASDFLYAPLFVVLVITIVSVFGGVLVSLAWRDRTMVAVPGLYENGLELPQHVFLPYTEVGTVRMAEIDNRVDGRYEVVHLFKKGVEDPKPFVDGRMVRVGFLGPEGLAELKERLEGARRPDKGRTPPELRVYGPRGDRS